MKKFIIKSIALLLPFAIILATYFYFDPFKVLRGYDEYYPENNFMVYNRDHISSEKYIANSKKYKYDSFIFGSSRTIAFKTSDWKLLLPPGSSPFVFDASSESIYGIWRKIKAIDENKGLLSNALLIIDVGTTFAADKNSEGHLYMKHPFISHESRLNYHTTFINAFLNQGFFIKYLDYYFFRTKRPYMSGFLEFRKIKGDPITNDEYIIDQDEELNNDSISYFKKREDVFYERNFKDSIYQEKSISERHIEMLKEIKFIFDKKKTNYKIIISPLYNIKFISRKDLKILKGIFGVNQVFDFSGINEFTQNKFNYYESSHYRPRVGKTIMSRIYSHK